MQLMSARAFEYLWVALMVVVLTPVLYLVFRHFILAYGLVWLVMLSIGFVSKKYPRVRLVQFSLFIALVVSMLIGMLPK
ncbi:MAG: hypothetical protein WAO95_04725 [Burkholderiales bacterium]